MRKIIKKRTNINSNIDNLLEEGFDIRILLIQELIPIGLMAVNDILQQEVTELAGSRYSRSKDKREVVRWGSQQGSVYLQDMKVKVRVPRVRNRKTEQKESEKQIKTCLAIMHWFSDVSGINVKMLFRI